ncbi:hypothetical protein V7087_09475 [Neobacillus niacini]|uniref:hypothetical protein n=1 Tax=Neobacillus niacini TaxID=86668 RepID=UPI00300003F4
MATQAATTVNDDGTLTTSGQTDANANLTITVNKGEAIQSENLMYINEFTADETGAYSITYEMKEPFGDNGGTFIVKVNSEGVNIETQELSVPGEDPGDGDTAGGSDSDGDGSTNGGNNTDGNGNSNGGNDDGNSNGGNNTGGNGNSNGTNNAGGNHNSNGNHSSSDQNRLPNTAGFFANYILIGAILLIIGLYLRRKKLT